ncbi:hypothetical protein GCM10027446_25610 [Angustibacter peucedani]
MATSGSRTTRARAHRTPKTLRLDPAGVQALSDLVAAHPGASENDVIQAAIVEAAERHSLEHDALAAFEQGARRWADVLDRLA